MWADLAAAVGWPDPGDPAAAVADLSRRGLVAGTETLTAPPVLAAYLLEQEGLHRLAGQTQEQLHFELAKGYLHLAEAAKKFMGEVFKQGVKKASQLLHNLHRQRLDFLHRGLRQALEQGDPLLQVYLLTELAGEARGSLAFALLAAYARRVAAGLEARPEAAGEHIGAAYHELGRMYANQRQWPEALASYQAALKWQEQTQQWHTLGSTHHQIGRVYEEQRQWQEALKSYQAALKWFEETQQWHALGGTHHQIGMVYQLQRQWQKALTAYLTAFDWLVKTQAQGLDICLNSLRRLAKQLAATGALPQLPPELTAKLAAILKAAG
jgi:tetratricopeptide (TPR) repeat protein